MTTQPTPYGSPEPARPSSPYAGHDDEELRKLAVASIKRKQAFRTHLFSFVAVITMMWVIWLVTGVTSGGDAWFPWPIFATLGWGIGLAFNWRAAYGPGSRAISESDVDAEMRRLRGE
jgi:hypothetical protein